MDYASGKDNIDEEIEAFNKWFVALNGRHPEPCCECFAEAVKEGEIKFSYSQHTAIEQPEIDETAWYVEGMWHLYYCPFCGADVKGGGFGSYRKNI